MLTLTVCFDERIHLISNVKQFKHHHFFFPVLYLVHLNEKVQYTGAKNDKQQFKLSIFQTFKTLHEYIHTLTACHDCVYMRMNALKLPWQGSRVNEESWPLFADTQTYGAHTHPVGSQMAYNFSVTKEPAVSHEVQSRRKNNKKQRRTEEDGNQTLSTRPNHTHVPKKKGK